MKKTIVSIFVIGLMVIACQNPAGGGGSSGSVPPGSVPSGNSGIDSSLNGSWGGASGRPSSVIKFNNGNFETFVENGSPDMKGTYTTSSSKISLTMTFAYGYPGNSQGLEPKWYSKSDLEKLNYEYWKDPSPMDYTINGNILTLLYNGETVTLTRQ